MDWKSGNEYYALDGVETKKGGEAWMRNSSEPVVASPYFLGIVGIFLACLIAANIMAVKLISICGLILPAAIVIFPMSYIVADILTEVYGYKQARRVIWLGFFCNLVVVSAFWIGQLIAPAPFWDGQKAYVRILGYTPRLLAASFVAYLAGEFLNAYVLAKMKVATKGKWLWARTIGSTLVGEGIDSLVFISLAFVGTMPGSTLAGAIVTQWLVKCGYEVVATPLTYLVVGFLKRKEGLDTYDYNINFSPVPFGR